MLKSVRSFVTLSAVMSCAFANQAHAVPWTEPGSTIAIPLAALPPPGVYFNAIGSYGESPQKTVTNVTPVLVWSTGWTVLGASYGVAVADPLVYVNLPNVFTGRGAFNPYISPLILSWNLGGGFFASYSFGVFVPVASEVTWTLNPNRTTSGSAFESRFALAYFSQDWTASANLFYGIPTHDSAGFIAPDYFNVDLAVTRKFGNWRAGPVAYGTWDLNSTQLGQIFGGPNREVAVGGLVGYDFGRFAVNAYVTHEVVNAGWSNFGKYDTRGWLILTGALWNPAPPTAQQVSAKY